MPGWTSFYVTLLHHNLYFGSIADIDKASSAHKWALHLTPKGNADDKPGHLSYLSNSLGQFECTRDCIDIDKAISVHEWAVDLIPKFCGRAPSIWFQAALQWAHLASTWQISSALCCCFLPSASSCLDGPDNTGMAQWTHFFGYHC